MNCRGCLEDTRRAWGAGIGRACEQWEVLKMQGAKETQQSTGGVGQRRLVVSQHRGVVGWRPLDGRDASGWKAPWALGVGVSGRWVG